MNFSGLSNIIGKALGREDNLAERYHSDLVRISSQLSMTQRLSEDNIGMLQDLGRSDARIPELLANMQDRTLASIQEKVLSREAISQTEAKKLIDSLSDITGTLSDIDVSFDVNVSGMVQNFKNLASDSRIDIDNRRKMLQELRGYVETQGVESPALEELKNINIQQLNFSREETNNLERVLSKLSDETMEVKTRATLNELNNTFDSAVLTQSELVSTLEEQTAEGKTFREKFLENPALFSMGGATTGMVSYLLSGLLGPLGDILGPSVSGIVEKGLSKAFGGISDIGKGLSRIPAKIGKGLSKTFEGISAKLGTFSSKLGQITGRLGGAKGLASMLGKTGLAVGTFYLAFKGAQKVIDWLSTWEGGVGDAARFIKEGKIGEWVYNTLHGEGGLIPRIQEFWQGLFPEGVSNFISSVTDKALQAIDFVFSGDFTSSLVSSIRSKALDLLELVLSGQLVPTLLSFIKEKVFGLLELVFGGDFSSSLVSSIRKSALSLLEAVLSGNFIESFIIPLKDSAINLLSRLFSTEDNLIVSLVSKIWTGIKESVLKLFQGDLVGSITGIASKVLSGSFFGGEEEEEKKKTTTDSVVSTIPTQLQQSISTLQERVVTGEITKEKAVIASKRIAGIQGIPWETVNKDIQQLFGRGYAVGIKKIPADMIIRVHKNEMLVSEKNVRDSQSIYDNSIEINKEKVQLTQQLQNKKTFDSRITSLIPFKAKAVPTDVTSQTNRLIREVINKNRKQQEDKIGGNRSMVPPLPITLPNRPIQVPKVLDIDDYGIALMNSLVFG